MAYLRYHIASGFVDMKLSVIDEDNLSVHAREGYDFIEADGLTFGSVYIDSGVPRPRIIHTFAASYLVATDEAFVLSGLPDDMWLKVENSDPVLAVNGALTITKPSDSDVMVEPVGKYAGGLVHIKWDDLAKVRESQCAAIDKAAEDARARVITLGSGQAMTYLRKADAARVFLAGGVLSDAQMARLNDEAARLGITVEQAANSIVTTADAWETIDASIDSIRLSTKAAINSAALGAEIDTIVRAVVWPV